MAKLPKQYQTKWGRGSKYEPFGKVHHIQVCDIGPR